MIPFLCDIPIISNVELNRPKIEYVSSITTLESDNRNDILNISKFTGNNIHDYDFAKWVGTTLTSNDTMKNIGLKDDLAGFFCDDYDIVVKIPMTTISKKIKIKRITKFTPKIVL
jgi:hypothetical protein